MCSMFDNPQSEAVRVLYGLAMRVATGIYASFLASLGQDYVDLRTLNLRVSRSHRMRVRQQTLPLRVHIASFCRSITTIAWKWVACDMEVALYSPTDFRSAQPFLSNDAPDVVLVYLTRDDLAKQGFPLTHAERDEIRPGLAVIVSLQPDRLPTMRVGVVRRRRTASIPAKGCLAVVSAN